jgi:hypothetical protein
MGEFTSFDYEYPLDRDPKYLFPPTPMVIRDYGQVYYRQTYHPPGDRVSVIRELLHSTYGEIPDNYTHEIHRIR